MWAVSSGRPLTNARKRSAEHLVAALKAYVDRTLPWLPKLKKDLWENGLYLAVNALDSDAGTELHVQSVQEDTVNMYVNGKNIDTGTNQALTSSTFSQGAIGLLALLGALSLSEQHHSDAEHTKHRSS